MGGEWWPVTTVVLIVIVVAQCDGDYGERSWQRIMITELSWAASGGGGCGGGVL